MTTQKSETLHDHVNASLHVLAPMRADVQRAQKLVDIGRRPGRRLIPGAMERRERALADAEARLASVIWLIEAVRHRVATTFEEACAADDRGESLIWCQCDVRNPCWTLNMPVTTPLRHWGYTPDMEGDGLACPDCQLRAALARVMRG
ncbi:MAG: hypothetical protein WC617_12650 [Rhodanobacter sp.]